MISHPKVVALGGGHGLAATLTALRGVTEKITAVVTVADNGGSSGRLREEFPIMPPGDLRMALAALCGDDAWGRDWADIMQYRFTSDGPMNGHALGNLLLAALWDRDEDVVVGLDRVAALLKVVGRVLPMSAEPLDIEATFENDGAVVEAVGQVAVATTAGRLVELRLTPENPSARPEVLEAIADADLITMGPGSWFSSVLPHLLVPTLRDAIIDSPAKKLLLLNLDSNKDQAKVGEYAGYSPKEHCEILQSYAPNLHFDFVVGDSHLNGSHALAEYLHQQKSAYIEADLRDAAHPIHHDGRKLTSTFAHIVREMLV
jgi:uncharacterized cofD-like protein